MRGQPRCLCKTCAVFSGIGSKTWSSGENTAALTSGAKRQEVSAPVHCPWEQRSVWIRQLRVVQSIALQSPAAARNAGFPTPSHCLPPLGMCSPKGEVVGGWALGLPSLPSLPGGWSGQLPLVLSGCGSSDFSSSSGSTQGTLFPGPQFPCNSPCEVAECISIRLACSTVPEWSQGQCVIDRPRILPSKILGKPPWISETQVRFGSHVACVSLSWASVSLPAKQRD